MSFVRFGSDGSEVYIFERDPDLAKECCGCALTAEGEPCFATTDLDAMLAHLAEHRAAGHVVPDWVDDSLRVAWNDLELGG